MASTINAISGGAGGLSSKGDASGALNIQTASTTAIAIDASQNVTFAQNVTFPNGTLCRAWVNFSGTTGTRNASFNVSSVTRTAVGSNTITFTTPLSDANYAAVVTPAGTPSECRINNATTTTLTIGTFISTGAATDPTFACVAVFR
jgi:hypothetical protein